MAAALTVAGQPVYTNLHAFVSGSPTDGASPVGLISDGNLLWGSTVQGGSQLNGLIFSMATNGTGFTPVYNFSNTTDGASPSELLLAGGAIYGTTTYSDGYAEPGAIYRFDTNTATFTVLHGFTNSPDGANPSAGLILSGAMLYGTTVGGGTNGAGTVFKLATNGANYTVLYQFTNGADGAVPRGKLVLVGSRLYGTASTAGTNGYGTLFTLDTNGNNFSVLYNFSTAPAPTTPYAGLTSDGAGMLYGVSTSGGISNQGTVFALGTNGSSFNIIHSFTNNEGLSPQSMLLFKNGMLFGSTLVSGAGNGGIVFQVATNGANFTVLYNFTNALTGSNPKGGMVLQNNTLFGTANASGPNGGGTVFGLQLTPYISQQPQPLTVTNGNPAMLSGGGGGVGTLGYQWYLNGVPVAGANNPVLNYGSVTTNQAGSYTLVVTNIDGSATSSPAVLTVLDVPWITVPPQSQTVTNGHPANFSVTAVNGTLTYQWYFTTNSVITLLSGQTASTFNIPAVTTNNAGAYSVVVSNSIGTSTSAPAVLTVVQISSPVITNQPHSQIITNGNNVTFSVGATGQNPLFYQWYSNSVNTAIGLTIAKMTNASMTFSNVAAAGYNGRFFTVVVSNAVGTATSTPAMLSVVLAPVIVTNPVSTVVILSNSASFSVAALGNNLTYRWFSNSVNTTIGKQILSATTSTYTFTATTNLNGLYFSAVVNNPNGNTTSSPPAQLTVIAAPLILTNPLSATVSYGGATNFTVSAIGAITLKYQWYFNTNTLLLNQTNSLLPIPDATNQLAGYYSVIITNTYGRATSSPALLTIAGGLPTITLQPLGATIPLGSSVTFTSAATATGPGTLGYQWLFNTNTLIAGANATNLIIIGANQPGYYAMVATNNFGAATSSPALLALTGQAVLLSSAFDPASGSYLFNYLNLAGSTNRLWATTNLADPNAWQVIATNVMATNGTWNFTDSNSAKTNAVRFYRFSSP
jgi:uncharacterized repeat protein (TIGR03803 family)